MWLTIEQGMEYLDLMEDFDLVYSGSRYVRQSTLPWDDGKPDIAFNEVGGLKAAELRIMNLKPGVSGTKTWEEIGVWRSWELEHELDIKGIVWPEMRHVPPEGVPEKFHLRVTFMEEPPFINMERPDPMTGKCKVNQGVICRVVGKDVNDDNDFHPNETFRCCSGYCIDLLTKFSNDLGFTYDLFRVEDGLWGAVLPNGSWNGLIAALLKNKADIVLTSLKINSARATAIDFSVPFLDTGISIVVAKRTGIISPTAFLEPFDTASWMLVAFVAIQVATFAIFFFEWLSPRGYNMKCRPPTGHRFSLLRCYWLVLAELFQASVNVDLPKGYTARFLASVWSMFAVVFIAVYTANLAAFMITREEHHELSGLHDPRIQNPFSSKPALKFGTIPHGNTDAVLRSNMPHVHHYMQRYNRSSPRTGVQALKTGELDAFVYDATALEYLVGQDDGCKVLTVGAWYAMTGYGVGFPKGSKYFSDFNKKLVEYRENGDLERLRRFWFTGACQRNKQTQSTSSPLAVEQFLSAFLLLSAGILVAVIALIFESCYFNHMRKYMMRSNVSPCITLFSVSLGHSLAPSSMGDVVRTAAHAHKNQLDLSLNKGDDMDEDVAHMQIEEVEMELAFARKRIFELEQDLIRKGLMSRGRIASTDRANCPAEFAEFVSVV
ncbi:unnamed protein product [Cyprideis torosa]|uniref:Uncharacterized protein n=1 Tax=Cyprideis torosa TaxID=163714 RepID=A0A7R8W8W7_9CRUS|nr:unnamed protein product [Cyprideis torosa]CAG0889035.1 unnamed protein product [Cyprideis torosa]